MSEKLEGRIAVIALLLGLIAIIVFAVLPIAFHKQIFAEEEKKNQQTVQLILETFPQYEWTNYSINEAMCYQKPTRGGWVDVCYEPTTKRDPVPYGLAEVKNNETGELDLVRLYASKEGPLIKVIEDK